jgi:hypothetical protein
VGEKIESSLSSLMFLKKHAPAYGKVILNKYIFSLKSFLKYETAISVGLLIDGF